MREQGDRQHPGLTETIDQPGDLGSGDRLGDGEAAGHAARGAVRAGRSVDQPDDAEAGHRDPDPGRGRRTIELPGAWGTQYRCVAVGRRVDPSGESRHGVPAAARLGRGPGRGRPASPVCPSAENRPCSAGSGDARHLPALSTGRILEFQSDTNIVPSLSTGTLRLSSTSAATATSYGQPYCVSSRPPAHSRSTSGNSPATASYAA